MNLSAIAPKFGWTVTVSGKENVDKAKVVSADDLYKPVEKNESPAGDTITFTYNKPENIVPTRDYILQRGLEKAGVPKSAIQFAE